MPSNIRIAKIGDETRIAELGKDFFKESGYIDVTEYNQEKAALSLKGMIENENCCVIVAEVDGVIIGAAGGYVQEIWFADDFLGQELFWYIDPNYRGGAGSQLLKELELGLKEKGADVIAMIGLEKTKSLNNYFIKKGYRASEYSYIKRL